MHFAESFDEAGHEAHEPHIRMQQQIESAFADHRYRSVGEGSTGHVRIISKKDSGGETPWVVKTRIAEPPSHATTKRTFKTEWQMHQQAYTLITDAAEKAPGQFTRIPKPIGTLESATSHQSILEYIEGETLFERALRFLLLRYAASEEDEQNIATGNREELVNLAVSENYIDIFSSETQNDIRFALRQPSRTIPALTEEHFEEIVAAGGKRNNEIPLLSHKQHRQLERTIALLHANTISHADFHPSNIMMQKDGTMVIIDFGLSRKVTTSTHKTCREDLEYLQTYKKLSL